MTPLQIARVIANEFDPLAKPVEVRTVCRNILLTKGFNGDEAFERADSVRDKVIQRLTAMVSEAHTNGWSVRFSFHGSDECYIHGSCFELPRDSHEVREAKRRRSHAWKYSSKIENLNPLQFEALCCGLLGLMGVEGAETTRRSGDEGIDFFGRIRLAPGGFGRALSPNFASKIYFWIVGQAKHYKKTVAGTPELRDLFGSIELAKAGVTNPLGGDAAGRVRIADPIIYLFVTSGRISSQARKLLERSGVFGIDGEMVSTFLSDHRVAVDDAGRFIDQEFDRWVSEGAR